MRTRDELRMTTDSYKTLFASSVVFGIKKQLRAEQGIPALEEQVAELEGQHHDIIHMKLQFSENLIFWLYCNMFWLYYSVFW